MLYKCTKGTAVIDQGVSEVESCVGFPCNIYVWSLSELQG